MNALMMGSKTRWTAAGLGATVAAVVLIALFRAPTLPSAPTLLTTSDPAAAPRRPPAIGSSPVELTKPDAANADETLLRDLTPLFLPTERNASPKRLTLREPGETVLETQTLKLTYADAAPNIARELPPVATLGGQALRDVGPVDVLRVDAMTASLSGFGRDAVTLDALPARGGFLEVVATTTARRVLAEALPVEARPATDQLWEPLEFVAAVDAAGLVAPLLVSRGSRVEEVDNHFKNYLVQRYRIGERLTPGFYRIAVAP
jgi:hypothetical protein